MKDYDIIIRVRFFRVNVLIINKHIVIPPAEKYNIRGEMVQDLYK